MVTKIWVMVLERGRRCEGFVVVFEIFAEEMERWRSMLTTV